MNRFTRLFTYPVTLALALSFTGGTQAIKSALTTMGGGLPSILAMVLGLCLLITIHEFGHWLVARIFGFKTPVFSIGFGKREWSWVLGTFWETEWRIAPILAGGYVSIPELGDETATKEDLEKAQSSTRRFPVWQRICVAAAGVTFNVISAVIMLFALFSIY
jgi:regulator of sigma E protease